MQVEIDDTVLLKIDLALKASLYLLRDLKEFKFITSTYDKARTVIAIDNLADAVIRISETVRKIKENI